MAYIQLTGAAPTYPEFWKKMAYKRFSSLLLTTLIGALIPLQVFALSVKTYGYVGPEHYISMPDGRIVGFNKSPLDIPKQRFETHLPGDMTVVEDISLHYAIVDQYLVLQSIELLSSKMIFNKEGEWPPFTQKSDSRAVMDFALALEVKTALAQFTDLLYQEPGQYSDSYLYLKIKNGKVIDQIELSASQNKVFRELLYERYKQTQEYADRMEDMQQYGLSDEYYEAVIRIKTKHFNDVEVSFPAH